MLFSNFIAVKLRVGADNLRQYSSLLYKNKIMNHTYEFLIFDTKYNYKLCEALSFLDVFRPFPYSAFVINLS